MVQWSAFVNRYQTGGPLWLCCLLVERFCVIKKKEDFLFFLYFDWCFSLSCSLSVWSLMAAVKSKVQQKNYNSVIIYLPWCGMTLFCEMQKEMLVKISKLSFPIQQIRNEWCQKMSKYHKSGSSDSCNKSFLKLYWSHYSLNYSYVLWDLSAMMEGKIVSEWWIYIVFLLWISKVYKLVIFFFFVFCIMYTYWRK